MAIPKPNNRIRQRITRLQPGERYCGNCKLPKSGMFFIDENNRNVCFDCAGKLADPFR